MIKIAVIGANGYIARNLVHVLRNRCHDAELKLYGIEKESVDGEENYTTIDMTDINSVKKLDLSCDIIYMLVGRTGSMNGFDEYSSFIASNEMALLNLIAEYRRQQSKARIVFPSTRLVYKGKKGLQSEDDEKEFKTVYAINKYSCEQYLQQFHRIFGVQYTIFRICIPYGTLIPNVSSYGTAEFMLTKALNGDNISLYGDGTVRRTLTYMGDLCDILIEGALNEACANEVFNIGGEDYSLKEMASLIAQKYNVGIDYIPWPETARIIESGDTVFNDCKLVACIGNLTKTKYADWINDNI